MHIFLTGFMGVGKTFIGKQLSELLNLPFIDLDEAIEKTTNTSIPDLFESEGEDSFRFIETQTLQNTVSIGDQSIISLGGGTICNTQNSKIILENGISVYLYKPWSALETNLSKLEGRPVLKQNSLTQLKLLFIKREHFYEQSQLKMPINTDFEPQILVNYLKLLTNR